MQDIVIVGAGGFGRELAGWLEVCFAPQEYRLKGFLGTDPSQLDGYEVDAPVLDDPATYVPQTNDRFLLAIGDVGVRRRVVQDLCGRGAQFMTMIHPSAVIAGSAQIGCGAVIYPLATVSNGASLDEFVHLSLYASVGHDARVGKFCLLSPYATLNGFALLDDDGFMGTGSSIAPGVSVGQNTKISAKASVHRDVDLNSFVHGVPGRQMRRLDVE